jgi:hypothetical protein
MRIVRFLSPNPKSHIAFASSEKCVNLPTMIVTKNNAARLQEEISLPPLFVYAILNRLSAYRYFGS